MKLILQDSDMMSSGTIVIYGASSGIGRATAIMAADRKMRVRAIGRDADRLQSLADDHGCEVMVADILDEQAVNAALNGLENIDHVVVTAGTLKLAPVLTSAMEDLRHPFEERVFGAMRIVRAAAGKMAKGSFTFLTGDLAEKPRGNISSTSAAAAALEALTKAWLQELAPIRFNVISPGVIDTPLQEHILGGYKAAFLQDVAKKSPVQCVGRADEVAQIILDVAHNGFINGATVKIDGGLRFV